MQMLSLVSVRATAAVLATMPLLPGTEWESGCGSVAQRRSYRMSDEQMFAEPIVRGGRTS
ncbi:hypothetical protein D5R93_07830 [Actinomyces lilanjuaniae]|uniref:Secreted protein n=1 Tax=Actinomyces lilanjuaniae TaxID=2321394 RepID=A0ABN5PNJ9_9ACTO|nr:hypothetical protein D5R93_07830 [Actinomyces lilanjuaniae]